MQGGMDGQGFDPVPAQVRDAGVRDSDRGDALHPVPTGVVAPWTAPAGEATRSAEPTEASVDDDAEPEHLVGDATATAPAAPVGECCFIATRYGESYEGSPVGCPAVTLPAGRADNRYHSSDPQILAAPPARFRTWECGQGLVIVNPRNGRELEVVRMDSCPGCGAMHVDLSEAGMAWLCGVEYPATCDRLDGLVIVEAW